MFDQTQVPRSMGKHIAIVLASLCFTPSSQASEIADLLLTNAKATSTQRLTLSQSVGSILAIGTREELNYLIKASTQLVDLDDGFIMPGFIDNHNHVFEAASPIGETVS